MQLQITATYLDLVLIATQKADNTFKAYNRPRGNHNVHITITFEELATERVFWTHFSSPLSVCVKDIYEIIYQQVANYILDRYKLMKIIY